MTKLDLELYRDAIRNGRTPNIPAHAIEDVFAGLDDRTVKAYLARRRRGSH